MNVSSMVASGYAAKTASAVGNLYASAAAFDTPAATHSGSASGSPDTVTISQAARDALAAASTSSSAGTHSVEARLAEIKSKDAVTRTADDTEYLFAHDAKLAAIRDKINANNSASTLTAEELDYQQKAGGFVNTMAYLSPAEKALYDKMVASGNTAAAAGMSQIALTRTMGHTAGGSNGTTYDPINTKITADNIVKYFSHSIIDPSGKAQAQFQALIEYLQNNPATA